MRKVATFSFFILIVLGFLGLIDTIIYNAVALIFGITESLSLLLLSIGLAFLSTSFILASIIGNYYYNWFTRSYYIFSAIWIGLSIYLFLASVLYGLIILVMGQSSGVMGLFLIGLAIALSSSLLL